MSSAKSGELKYLDFINAVFAKGLNWTVRWGRKWMDVAIDAFVQLPQGIGRIEKIYHCRLACIPKEVYEGEHDCACDNFGRLLEAMKRAYPEIAEMTDEDQENIIVTCLAFYVYERKR